MYLKPFPQRYRGPRPPGLLLVLQNLKFVLALDVSETLSTKIYRPEARYSHKRISRIHMRILKKKMVEFEHAQ